MPADYSAFKLVLNDLTYATKINAFIDAVQVDMNLKLSIADYFLRNVVTKTSNFTVAETDCTLNINCSIADITATLPDATTCSGRELTFRRVDEAYGYRALIGTIYELYNIDEYITFQSDGTNWVRVG